MVKQLPTIIGTVLAVEGKTIPIGSAAWDSWLLEAKSFRYEEGEDAITVRKQNNKWYAYRKRDGKLYNTYVGELSSKPVTAVIFALSDAVRTINATYEKDKKTGVFVKTDALTQVKQELEQLRAELEKKEAVIQQLAATVRNLSERQSLGESMTAIAS